MPQKNAPKVQPKSMIFSTFRRAPLARRTLPGLPIRILPVAQRGLVIDQRPKTKRPQTEDQKTKDRRPYDRRPKTSPWTFDLDP